MNWWKRRENRGLAAAGWLGLLVVMVLLVTAGPVGAGEGLGWEFRSVPSNTLRDVTWGGDSFVAVGSGGIILTSPDGSAWTARLSGSSERLRGVTYANGMFVAVGRDILTSPDGITWTHRGERRLDAVAWGSGNFVALANQAALVSPDGIAWMEHGLPALNLYPNDLVWGGDKFVAVGSDSSGDGLVFTPLMCSST